MVRMVVDGVIVVSAPSREAAELLWEDKRRELNQDAWLNVESFVWGQWGCIWRGPVGRSPHRFMVF